MAKQLRLDKFLCELAIGTRSEVKILLKKGMVTVNGVVVKSPDVKIDPDTDQVTYQGQPVTYQKYYYYMLHKPAGVITATQDANQKTVMDLLGPYFRKDLFPVGRLDKDTEGFLLITNDGELAHALLSPKKHVPKTYFVEVPQKLSFEQIQALEQGVDIKDDTNTLPAKVEVVDDTHILLTIHEGRYHQVKRMLEAVGSKVLYLKRTTFGSLALDETLEKGACRPLHDAELKQLKANMHKKMFDLSNVKAAFFDLDGTLVDSMHVWKDIDIEFLGRFGYELPKNLQKEIEGISFIETAHYFKNRFDIPLSIEEIMQCWNDMAYDKYAKEVTFKEGAFAFLKELKKQNIRTVICTSNSRELVNAVGNHLGFLPYFDEILSSGDVQKGKPSPDIYLEAAKRVGVAPEQCIVFEDVCAGIMAGKAAGMRVCAVADPFSEHQWEEKTKLADYNIENYYPLLAAISGMEETKENC